MCVLLQKIGVVLKKEWAQENTKLCLEIHKVHTALYHQKFMYISAHDPKSLIMFRFGEYRRDNNYLKVSAL